MITTLKPVMRMAQAVVSMGTRLAAPWKCSMTTWLIGDGHASKLFTSVAMHASLRSVTKVRFPVVQCAFGPRRVEHAVQHAVGDRSHLVHDRRPEGLDGLDSRLPAGKGAAMRGQDPRELGARP